MPDINKLRCAALWSWFISLCQSLNLGTPQGDMQPVSGDASFRRYFRGTTDKGSWILVDAPVAREDSKPFISVQRSLAAAGVQVPQVLAADIEQGFMCLQDLGSELLLSSLSGFQHEASAANWNLNAASAAYKLAFEQLLKIQHCDPCNPVLPLFDRPMLLREMQLFTDWLCKGLLQLELSTTENHMLDKIHEILIASALSQPQVYVHRDYHSRNLMLNPGGLGVIDFQDAVYGPFTYDLVSLLKDCYIKWPAKQVEQWALDYLLQAQKTGIALRLEAENFLNRFHLMGAQRHLKAAGIFCRLWLRDGKPGYLPDIVRTLSYISEIPTSNPDMNALAEWLTKKIIPLLQQALQELKTDVHSEQSGTGPVL